MKPGTLQAVLYINGKRTQNVIDNKTIKTAGQVDDMMMERKERPQRQQKQKDGHDGPIADFSPLSSSNACMYVCIY